MKIKFWGIAVAGTVFVLMFALALSVSGGHTPAALAQAATGTPRAGIVSPATVTATLAVKGTAAPAAQATASVVLPLLAAPVVTTTKTTTATIAITNTAVGAARGPLAGTITVVGEGRVKIKPDIATINIGVENVQPTVKQASDQTKQAMDAVLKALKAQHVADNDIQTSGFSIFVERTAPADNKAPAADQVRYHVSNNVAITIRDLNQVSNVLDAAIEAGANNIFGVNFSLADPSKVEAQGRQTAVADALRRARELAQLNGVQLGGVVAISEVVGNQGGFIANSFRDTALGKGGGGGGPIAPGELELSMQLQITYAIQ